MCISSLSGESCISYLLFYFDYWLACTDMVRQLEQHEGDPVLSCAVWDHQRKKNVNGIKGSFSWSSCTNKDRVIFQTDYYSSLLTVQGTDKEGFHLVFSQNKAILYTHIEGPLFFVVCCMRFSPQYCWIMVSDWLEGLFFSVIAWLWQYFLKLSYPYIYIVTYRD